MKLTHVRVTKYRCIEDSTEVPIEPDITALIGRNESGKTAFLEALRRLNAADGAAFDVTADYPRTQYGAYRRRHARAPDTAVMARFSLLDEEIREVEKRYGKGILLDRTVTVRRNYKNQLVAELPVSEEQVIRQIVNKRGDLEEPVKQAALGARSFKGLTAALGPWTDKSRGAAVLWQVAKQLEGSPLSQRIWDETLLPRLPRFVTFGDDDVMPGAISLHELTAPDARSRPRVSTMLALLDLAGVEPQELDPDHQSYEELKARIEAAALSITDELVSYWTQDKDLEVTIDVAAAGVHDVGFSPRTPVLRVRIGNRSKRASLPLGERSRGFAWFFSVLVRLVQLGESATPFVILLDEPAQSLHAGMQGDFRRFIEDRLGPYHQVIYTTHSPFMIDVARLDRARAVTLYASKGTVLSSDLHSIDPETLMPLRAALGAALVEGLLPKDTARATLLVRDASDLVWLRAMSSETLRRGKAGLDPRFDVVPIGGALGFAPYALLSAHPERRLVLLQEHDGVEGERAARLASSRLVQGLRVVPLASFVAPSGAADLTIEDLLDVPLWLSLVTEAHKLSPPLSEDELGPAGGIIARTLKGLEGSGETLDRLRVAETAIRRFGSPLPPGTVDRFARLFETLNAHLP